MSRTSKTIRFTVYCMLGLYFAGLTGFITFSMIHSLEHFIAESWLPPGEEPASHKLPYREAGCKPVIVIPSTADSSLSCPGCSKQQKYSAVMIKYYRICNFHSLPVESLLYEKRDVINLLTYLNRNDQASFKPPTPPPEKCLA